MNHVFMDFENVHQVDLNLIGAKSVSFTLMVGPQQTKLDSSLVEKLMEYSASVRLVKLKTKAKNALDFALSYYLGHAALADPTAYFHIIAKDTGYDMAGKEGGSERTDRGKDRAEESSGEKGGDEDRCQEGGYE